MGCCLCSAWLYATLSCDQGLAKVVLVKPWFRIVIGLPLRLYSGINTPSGAIMTGCMRTLVSVSQHPAALSSHLSSFSQLLCINISASFVHLIS